MNFIKTFLAAILAFVVGSFLVFFLWIFIPVSYTHLTLPTKA